jgi:chromosome segregation ATPase
MGSELLFPFIASVVVILLFRKLDRSNYRLSQMKKHSAKMSEDISQAAMNGIQAVNDAKIDLEITGKQARKTIQDIDVKSKEAESLMESIKQNREYLDSISSDLRAVVKLAGEIKTEAAYIQEGMQVMQSQRESINDLEKEIRSIREEMNGLIRNFNDTLQTRTSDILESLATKIVELESLLEVKSDKLDESLNGIVLEYKDKLKNEVEVMAEETVGKVEVASRKLEDYNLFVRESEKSLEVRLTRYKDATEAISEKIEKLDTRFEEKAETVGEIVQDKLDSFEKKFQERFDSIMSQVTQGKEAIIGGLKMEVDSIRSDIESMSLETMTKRDELLNDTRRQAESIASSIQIFQEKYLEADNKLLREADLKKAELLKEIVRFEEEFQRIKENFYTDTEDRKDSLIDSMKNFESEMNRVANQIEHTTKEKYITLKNELEDSLITLHGKKKSEILDDMATVELRIRELGKETLQKIKTVDDYFYDLKNALLESAKDIIKQVETEVSKVSINLEKEKEKTDGKIEYFMEAWNSELEKIKSRTSREIDNLTDRLKDIHIEGRELTEVFKTEFQAGRSELENLMKKYSDQLSTQTDSIATDVQAKVKRSQEEVDSVMARIQKAGLNLYEKQESLLSEYGEKLYKDLQGKLEKVRIESEELLEDIQKAGMSLLEKQEEKIDKLTQTIDERISRQLTVLTDKGQLQLGKLESRIASYVQDVKQNIENTLKHAKDDSDRQITTFNSQIQKTFKEIEKSNQHFLDTNRQEFARTREEFNRIKTEVDSDLRRVADIKKGLAEYLEEESSHLKNTLDSITDKVEDIQSYSDLFDRTRELIHNSEETMKNLSTMLEQLKTEGGTANQFLKHAELIRSTKKEMEAELRLLETHKLRIEQIDNELARANNVCYLINKRTDELHDKISMITSVDQKLIEIERIQNELDFKLSEVRVVNDRISDITDALNSNNKSAFEITERVQKVYRAIEKIESREADLLDGLTALEDKTIKLNNKNIDVKSIEAKFDQVESLMNDLASRHKQIAAMQKKIETLKSETEEMKGGFENLLSEADEKFDKLSDFLVVVDAVTSAGNSKNISKNFKIDKDTAEILKRKKATVLNLYEKFDWSSDVIAEKLNLEKSLVDTIISKKGL